MPIRPGVNQESAVPSVGMCRATVQSSMQSVTMCEMIFAVLYGSGEGPRCS
jgi:hypothetical protein